MLRFKCNAIIKPIAAAAETVMPKRFIDAQIQGPVGRSVLRRAKCHQIFNVGFLRGGSQPRHFASAVSEEEAHLHGEEECVEHEVSGRRFFQICTARLDAFGTNSQRV